MTIYGRSEELVSRCVECDLAEPESLASLGGSAPGLVDGILSLVYVCYLLNHIACTALDGKISLLALTGITPDISIILLFTSISLCSMQHMSNISLLKVKRGLATG